ncbi:amino acid adenylation domain-containing protein [Ralstonia nicotianae]
MELFARLKKEGVQFSVKDGSLVVRGNRQSLSDPAVAASLREHKTALIELIQSGAGIGTQADEALAPPGIEAGCERITPAMLPLATLSQEAIDRIVSQVPGGAANIEDIYPLAPLQEGILYHHLAAQQGDPYVLHAMFGMADRERVNAFAQALQAVIDRHPILRTAVVWQGLDEPMQVVWRHAGLVVEEVALEPGADPAGQLRSMFDPRRRPLLAIGQAPLVKLVYAADAATGRCVAMLLFHHLVLDHLALERVRQEMQAHLSGQAAWLPAVVPYRDYVAQAKRRVSQAAHEAFFREMLGDVEAPTLPFGLQDVQGDGGAIEEATLRLDAALSARLRHQARQAGVSAASLHHLAWARVVAVLSGRDDVVFGTVLLGRLQGGRSAERALGLFINTLPLRVTVHGQDVLAGTRAVHARLSALLGHEHAPLALAQRCSGVAAPQPLFSALLNYRHSAAPAASAATAPTWSGIDVLEMKERTNYPLTVSVDDLGDGFELNVQSAAGIDPERIAGYLETALVSLTEALERGGREPLHSLTVLPAAERQLLLARWNETAADSARQASLSGLFEAQVVRAPEAIAIEQGERQLSYRALNALANRLAWRLREAGVKPGDRVAILLERSIELVASELAILKCGAVYVPLDCNAPQARLRFLLEDVEAALLLTASGLDVPVLAGLRRLDVDGAAGNSAVDADLPPVPGGEAAAYVLYTSGSTGLPKGVVVPHRAISRLVLNNGYAAFCADDRMAFASNPAFDASTLDVWVPLLNGGRVVIIDQPTVLAPERFAQALRRGQVSVLWMTAGQFHQYAPSLIGVFPQLRYLMVGGDVLDPATIAMVLREGAPQHLLNGYGPTETTTFATTHLIQAVAAGRGIPIGRPIANTQIYVLDAYQQPVPLGVTGEIYVGGAGVGLGYLNRPELTAERFVVNPFHGEGRERMYKTGDLGRWLPDGSLEYQGRADAQVKLRGFRIELGEIEASLSQCAGVSEAVVIVREDTPGERRLVAYYVSGEANVSGEAIEAQALREQLQASLPEYMVPAAYVKLERLPLTPNGKLDRRGLPAPEGQAYASKAYEAPQGEVEQTLVGIWQTLLGVERVGRHDDFFALGGHSLQAVRLVAQVRTQLGAELGLTELFAQPSLSAVAQAIVRGRGRALPAITVADRSGPLPLSFAQQRLWFLAQMEGGSEAYHIPVGLRLKGELDEDALRRSLDRIVARHEALRTRFEVQEGQAVQFIVPADVGLTLEWVDLSTEEASEHQLGLQAEAEARTPFDLEQGPLIRGRLVKLGEQEHVLLITMHHIVSDGWSQGVLARELGTLYEAYRSGGEDPLPALPIQYADYAVWQRRWLEGGELRRQGTYWEQALAGAPTLLSLPTDRARPAQQDYAGGSVEVIFDETLSAGLRKLSQRHGTTLFMTVLAGWSALLSRLSGQEEVVVGSPVANRTRSEVEGLIGFFVNTLALRVEVGGTTVSELLGRVKAKVLEAQAHQDLPFEQVVERVRPVRSLSHSPVFQAALSWLNTEAVGLSLELEGLTIEGVDAGQAAAKFDLTLELRETSEGLAGSLDYATALFDRETIERYLGYLHRLLKAMAADDSQEVNRIALLDEGERAQLLDSWNETAAPYPQASTIQGLFEAQVRRTPEAIAVEHEGQQVSYAELNARANRVAHALIGLGVGPDARVGLCAERSVELVVGLLGILKAGGGYVPLDPSYPQDRLAYMLEDSAPVAVLTQGLVREQLGMLSVPVLDLDGPLEEAEHDPQVTGLEPHHLAYVIYTSGSTGRPKGVMNEHRGVVNRLWWAQQTYRLDASDRVLQKTPFGFDVSVWELFWPLLAGARLVMARPEGHKAPAYLAATIEQAGITTLHFVPSMLQLFLDQVEAGRCQGLRRMLCSGEALPHALQQRSLARFPHSELHNLYGPTEAAIDVTAWRCNAEIHPGVVPIGRPIANTQMYVLDGHQQPVPLGVTGEIYIGGVGVARGYLNRPELTAERFVVNPFHGEGRERMYRTGDLGRWLPDGSLAYQGRADAQVKLRGFRIELGEIEARLSQCAGVSEAVVTMREDVPGEQRLVAYYVSDEAIEAQTLREQLQASLPEYMVPAAYVRLEHLPLTPNGKLDRKGLPAPDGQAYASTAYEAPQGEVEQTLAGIWQTLLGVERVGRHDDFFALGGHSLQAVRLMSLVEQAGWRADVSRLFLQPTLAGFSASITVADAVDIPANRIASGCTRITPSMLPLASLSQAAIDRMAAQVPGGAANIEDIYPLAPLQEGILYHHLMAKQRDPYLLFAMFRMDSRARLEAFAQGLQSLIVRHTILRTAVIWDGLDEPMQVVWRQAALERQQLRLDAADGDIATQLKQRFDQGLHGLDLRQAPLMRLVFAEDAARGGWVAMLVFHHMIDDATSMKWLHTELEACLANEARHLPRAIPFRNYVARTRQAIAGNAHEAFFREMLADVVEPTLPFGLQDARGDDLAIGQATRRLSGPLSRRLRQQARLLKVSAASLHHLAWARVVSATSGRDDVVFGTVLMGRSQGGRGAEHTVGMFINTLPLRVLLDDRMVSAGARDTHVRLAALMGHEYAPLAEAQRCSGVAAPQPLFGALLNYRQNMPQPEPAGQVSAAWAGIDVLGMDERTNYPLTAVVDDLGEDFGLIVQSVPGMDAERIVGYLETALASLVASLERGGRESLRSLTVLPEAERHQQIDGWNRTQAAYASASTLPGLVEAQAARTPDAIAVEHGASKLSYRELDRQANRLAHRLIARGVVPDARVGLCVERGLPMVIGVLGILKAGGSYVPLDPSYPRDRLAYMLEDSAPVAVVAQSGTRDRLGDRPVAVVDLDEASWQTEPSHRPEVAGLSSHHAAYVIYTSGSTGRPKGVTVEHRQVVNLLESMRGLLAMTEADRWLAVTTLGFDIAGLELYLPLISGAVVVVLDREASRNAQSLSAALEGSGATVMQATPSTWRLLLESGWSGRPGLKALCGGEALPGELAGRLRARVGRLWNVYGPTETTIWSSAREVDATDAGQGVVPIGRPIANTQMYVLDAYRQPVPLGVTGEIYIGGAGVARGYLNRPELTAERFVVNPFHGEGRERMYRTGDLGRWLPDGSLEYQGRADAQVKLRGFRIELGEIEARLSQCAGVSEAVVTMREDAPGEQRLVAYYVSGEAIEAQTLREQLQASLPEYMVPAAYVRLERLPLTPNGKLDRKELPAPEGQAYASTAYEAPQGEVEVALAGIWQTLLGVERVGRHDDFFTLGGHSLQAVRLVAQVRTQLGAELGLTELFAQPSLSAVAQAIVRGQGTALPAITVADRGEPLPLSFAQQRLWFLAQMEGGSEAYHIPVGLRLKGELDEDALRRSLDRIVARHEALRTRFEVQEGQAVQLIVPADVGLTLEWVDLSTEAASEHQLGLLAEAEARTPFDLEQGPLIRGRLVKLGEQEHVLLITMHHIVSDGWSQGVLARELGTLYEAYRAGNADPLPALPIQYADYAVWQRRWLEGGELQRQGTYWEQALAGAPTLLSLPTDRARPAQQDYAGGSVEVIFDETLSAGLRKLSQRHGTTLFMTVLAGWSALLSRLSGQEEVVVGSPVANRTRSEVEGLIGFFVNTLALRVEVGGATVSELLGRVKAKVLEAQAHQDLPFEQVVERVRPVRSLSHSPVFQAALSWLNTEAVGLSLELEGLTIEGVDAGQAAAKFDLTLELRETSEGLTGSLDYATALFDRATIERYLGYLYRLLKVMAADDSQEVNRIALLDEGERAQLLDSWNETAAPYPQASTIHGLFEAQVRRTPEAIAVEHEGQQVSYAELNARANRVAHALIGLGVGPDARVGLCAERSVELVVGLLGILKAGGGYVPLDPSYPQDRLAYMLEDSAPVAVLAQSNTREQLGALSVPVLDLASPLEGEAEHDPQVEALKPHHLAYVIYTSGSTGQPKGVEATIAGLTNRLQWFLRDVLTEAPVTALKTSIGFVDAVTETLGTLLAGGSLVVFDNAAVKDLSVFARRLRQTGVSHLVVVPSLLKYLLQSGEPRLDGLRTLVCSGERLAPELARQCLAAYPQVRLLNFYGSSEVNGDATFYRYAGPEHVPAHSVIGRPIANTQIYILDAYGAPVPIGVPGEIHVGGACVARGYLHRPGLTAERFVADPFHGDGRARMYRTGDLGCWQADGNIVYLGRNDHQVKLRGFRIEPGEIEARLAGCEGVREAVVLIRDDGVGEPRLVAYYSGPAALPAQALRAQLQAALPAYMVPAAYVYLERMPLTSSGKLNRHALPQPTAGAYAQHSYEAPRSGIETRLASIWQALLGVETIGRHDDFFALGGNSLQAVRLIGLLAKADCRVTLTQLLQHPNIASLAAVAERDGMRTRDQAVPVRTTGSQRPLFLVHEITGLDGYFTQLGAWIDADIPVYGLPAVGWGEPQLRTIEGLAKRLKAAMRAVQPHGPYRLAGWSFGGVLAYEIAIQLIGEDEEVEFLGLLDTRQPALVSGGKPKWAAENRPHHAQLLELCLAYWQQHSPGGPESAKLAGLAGVEDFSALLERCRAQALLAPDLADVTEPDLWHVLDRIVAHGDAQANYTVFPMPLKLHLFVAAHEQRDDEPPPHKRWLGWNAILPDTQLQRIVVPGTHQSMVLEHAQVLGEALSAALHAAAGQPQPALQEAHYTPLLTIDAGSHRRESIVCIPGAGDGVVRFMHLAEALGGARPLYGMQPRGVDGWRVPHGTVEAAAAAYGRALDAGQVARGIHLIGHSFGGWVALEMALQLQAAGRAVASLTLLDCEAPGSEAGWLGRTYTATQVLAKFVEAVELALGRSLGIDPARLYAADEAEQWRLIHAGMVGAGLIPRRSQPGMLRGPIRTFGAALRTPYRPGRLYTGPVRLVLADDPALSREANEREQCRTVSELRGWAPDLVAWRGPGNHFSLLTPPYVQQVAAWWEGLRAEEGVQPVT